MAMYWYSDNSQIGTSETYWRYTSEWSGRDGWRGWYGGVYYDTTGSGYNVRIESSAFAQEFRRVSSSIRDKINVQDTTDEQCYSILNFVPVTYNGIGEYDSDITTIGFIAEELTKIDPYYVEYAPDKDGVVKENDVKYSYFPVSLLHIMKNQKIELESIDIKLQSIEEKLSLLEK